MSQWEYRSREEKRAKADEPKRGSYLAAPPVVIAVLAVAWVLTVYSPPRAEAQVNDIFRITNGTFANHVEFHDIDLWPGKEYVLADLAGPGKITYFYYTDDSWGHATDGSGAFYAGLVLKVFWDDAAEPSIRVPLWAFFGVFGRKTIDYQSLPMQINHYNYMCYPSHDDYTSVAFWYQEGAHPAPPLPAYAERIAPNRGPEYPRSPLKK